MGASESKNSETINWKNINTDNMSSNINTHALSNEVLQLIGGLNIPDMTETTDHNMFNNFALNLNKDDKIQFNQLLAQISETSEMPNNNFIGGNLEDSPFISSEMYNNLLDTTSDVVQAGGNHNKDSSSSISSSTSSSSDMLTTTEETILKKKQAKSKKHNKPKAEPKPESEKLTRGASDYLSSSAHTDGDFSNSEKSQNTTTEKSESVSVNTSDINMVSDN